MIPFFSVLIINYNYDKFIDEAVQSVLNQTFKDYEIVICDDGSSDNSRIKIEKYKNNSNIKVVLQKNGGMASALNNCFQSSNGKYICILDSDDIFEISKLQKIYESIIEYPKSEIIIHKVKILSSNLRKNNRTIPNKLSLGNIAENIINQGGGVYGFPPASGLTFKRSICEKIFPIPLEFRRAADGYLVWASALIGEIKPIDESLTLFRIHGANNSTFKKISVEYLTKAIEDGNLAYKYQTEIIKKYHPEKLKFFLEQPHKKNGNLLLLKLYEPNNKLILNVNFDELLLDQSLIKRLLFKFLILLPLSLRKIVMSNLFTS